MKRFDYRGEFWFPAPPEEVWRTVERFDRFESWWRWLRWFQADRDGLVRGNVLHGEVVPPVPCRLHVDVALTSCDRPSAVEADVDGDLHGWARLRFADADGSGTRIEAEWSLQMGTVPLRAAAEVAYPMMRWGHDRVVDMAVAGFRRRALTAAR